MAGGRQTLHSERFCGRSNGRIKPIVPDAASVMSGGFAQGADFAKFFASLTDHLGCAPDLCTTSTG